MQTLYENIIDQFERAYAHNMVSSCARGKDFTTIQFCGHIKQHTIIILIKILEMRYHETIKIITKDQLTIEIWNKLEMFGEN